MYRGRGLPFILSTVSNASSSRRSHLGPGFLQYFTDSTRSDLEELTNTMWDAMSNVDYCQSTGFSFFVLKKAPTA
jgi:hypothetical protein